MMRAFACQCMDRGAIASVLTFLMILSMLAPSDQGMDDFDHLEDEPVRMDQLGGGGSLEDQCGSITFENLFEYTHATFDIVVNEDWGSADVRAVAWVNETLADDLRVSMDEFMAEVDPNDGGDSWISTDEREFFRALASECIEHTLTRIGIRDGPSHRGGGGVDWKNTSWEEDGVDIQEFNIVPIRHSQIRECTSAFGNDCEEVPVIPDENRDCDTDIAASQGVDECRIKLWLNATADIHGFFDSSNFTLVLNASNMSGAKLDFTFPITQDLRLDLWDECEGRDVGLDEETAGGQAPLRGSCIGDGSSTYSITENADGSLTYSLSPDSPRVDWPLGEDLFADFTTAPIPVDDPPEWTDVAPPEGAWFPSPNGGQHVWAYWEDVSQWFSDEGSVSNLDVRCTGAPSLQLSEGGDRSWWAEIPRGNTAEVSCEAVDPAGQSTGSRTWNLGVPFSLSTSTQILSDPHPITISPTSDWPDLEIEIGLIQDGQSSPTSTITFTGEVTVDLSSSNSLPGPVEVWVSVVDTAEVYSLEHVYDIGLSKESAPPVLTIVNTEWDGSQWSMQGQYSDPDGESVVFSMSIDGSQTGSVSSTGNTWSTPNINFELWSEGEHGITIEGCDTSGKCSEVFQIVNNSHLFDEPEPELPAPSEEEDEGGLLPAVGLPIVTVAAVAALIYGRRRG